jgi:hypothetical protein
MTLRRASTISASVLVLGGLAGQLVLGGALFGAAFLVGLVCFFAVWIVGGAPRTRYPVADDLRRADADRAESEPPIVPTNLPGPS